jgi:hypothetical protein
VKKPRRKLPYQFIENPKLLFTGNEMMRVLWHHISPCETMGTYVVSRVGGKITKVELST